MKKQILVLAMTMLVSIALVQSKLSTVNGDSQSSAPTNHTGVLIDDQSQMGFEVTPQWPKAVRNSLSVLSIFPSGNEVPDKSSHGCTLLWVAASFGENFIDSSTTTCLEDKPPLAVIKTVVDLTWMIGRRGTERLASTLYGSV